MKIFTSALKQNGAILFIALLGIAAQANGQIVFRLPQIVVAPPVIMVQPAVVAQPVVEVAPGADDYAPNPFDADISNVAPTDVVIMRGDTYIWAIDPNGLRYQRFYAHGDRRQEVFARRDELQRVMTRNGGHLPAANNNVVHRAGEAGRGVAPAPRLAAAAPAAKGTVAPTKGTAVPAKGATTPAVKGAVPPKVVKQEDHK